MTLELLNDLARKYNTDKGASFQGGREANNYMELYYEYFNVHFEDRTDVKKILEIGTNTGASLRTWADYFPNATVWGIDVTQEYENTEHLDHPRIKTDLVDQGDRSSLRIFAEQHEQEPFDIIIDDGSHEQTHQQKSLGVLFPFVKHDGLYIIEDLITGQDWWDANQYNVRRVTPTRDIMMKLEEGNYHNAFKDSALTADEKKYILSHINYCDFQESRAIIYGTHHPEIAFIGKRNP